MRSFNRYDIASILVLTAISMLITLRFSSSNLINDDAFVFFRYAEHIARGHGYVWNIGEQPVDGPTSPLFTVVLALFDWLGIPVIIASQILDISAAIALAILIYVSLRIIIPGYSYLVALAFSLLLVISPQFGYWSRAGMETPLYMFILTLATVVLVLEQRTQIDPRRGHASSALFFVAFLTRPDTLLFWAIAQATVILGASVAPNGITGSISTLTKSIAVHALSRKYVLLSFLLPLTLYYILHLWYFGEIWSYPSYAKAGGTPDAWKSGILYVSRLLRDPIAFGAWLLPVLFVSDVLKHGYPKLLAAYTAASTSLYFAYMVWTGGDFFLHFRFYMYIYPTLLILAACLLTSIGDRLAYTKISHYRVIPLILITPLFFNYGYPLMATAFGNPALLTRPLQIIDADDNTRGAEYNREIIGKYFGSIAKPDESISIVAAGAIPYYSKLKTIDMTGLLDKYMARQPVDPEFLRASPRGWYPGHVKGDGEYILSKRPTYIIITDALTKEPGIIDDFYKTSYRATWQIWRSNVFWECYDQISVPLAGKYFTYFRVKAQCAS